MIPVDLLPGDKNLLNLDRPICRDQIRPARVEMNERNQKTQ